MMSIRERRQARNKGISLVEIMVSLVIGMLGTLVIYQVFAESEARKRTTTGINDAQENGLAAILSIERDVRQAGYGYTSFPGFGGTNPALGCNVRAYNQNATPTSIDFRLIPILITDGGPGLSDAITVTYSTSSRIATPVPFDTPTSSAANYKLTNNSDKAGFQEGDLVLAVQSGLDCSLAQITGITGSGSDVLIHNPGAGGDYNKPGGLGVNYSAPGAQLLNLGNPVISRYFVGQGNNLSVSDLKLGNPGGAGNTLSLADNIVNLQARYGIDTNGDNRIDDWVEPTGPLWGDNGTTTPLPANVMAIRALRLAIVARSARMEGKETGEACTTTTTAPQTWERGPVVDLSADPDWRCYRYKVFQTIIPLRNMIWSEA